MGEHLGDVSQFVGFQSMASFVLFLEDFLERTDVLVLDLAKALRQLAEELLVGPLLRATIQDHVAQFLLLARLDLHLEQLVRTFLVVERRLDGQIDRAPEGHDIRLRRVNNRRGFSFS